MPGPGNNNKKQRQRQRAKEKTLQKQILELSAPSQPQIRRSVEDLAQACYKDLFPDAIGVYFDYGFINATTKEAAINLFGVYIGLIKLEECSRDKLHEACMQGRLADFIDAVFTTRHPTKATRGGYYAWFENNRDIVKNPYPLHSMASETSTAAEKWTPFTDPGAKESREMVWRTIPYFPGPPFPMPAGLVAFHSDQDIKELPSKDLVATLRDLKGIVSVDPAKESSELRRIFEAHFRELRDEEKRKLPKTKKGLDAAKAVLREQLLAMGVVGPE